MARSAPRPGDRPILGWREWVGLPGLGVGGIKVKLDTGARSSAIHAFALERFRRRGRDRVRFQIHPLQRDDQHVVGCDCEVVDERLILPSSGLAQRRLVIVTDLAIGDECWPIELTLANRDQMGFRMLLGRSALGRRFLIDPSHSFLGPRSRLGTQRPRRPRRKRRPPGHEGTP